MIGRNNPFNIRVSPSIWIGSDGSYKGFVNFISLNYGVRAACILIMRTYRKKRVFTVSQIIERFAPSTENDIDSYISFVCSKLDCYDNSVPSYEQFPLLLHYMSVFEGNPVEVDFIRDVIEHFEIRPYNLIL